MRDLVEIDATHEDKRMIGVAERVRIFGITPTRPENSGQSRSCSKPQHAAPALRITAVARTHRFSEPFANFARGLGVGQTVQLTDAICK